MWDFFFFPKLNKCRFVKSTGYFLSDISSSLCASHAVFLHLVGGEISHASWGFHSALSGFISLIAYLPNSSFSEREKKPQRKEKFGQYVNLAQKKKMSEADTLVGGTLCSCHNFDLQLALPQLYHCETLCILQPPVATSAGC